VTGAIFTVGITDVCAEGNSGRGPKPGSAEATGPIEHPEMAQIKLVDSQ
jgi:hypothetical protein